ncbi:MAG: hypothetical protein RML49_05790 [Verrucomicrobiae bacterium]|nr:hypothetical protein [Verrucomicrobiae bacterium]
MLRLIVCLISICLISVWAKLHAQAPVSSRPATGSESSPSSTPSSGSADSGSSKILGKELPFLDLGNEIATWDGKVWNINNNRIFRARLEKYLNAPEETDAHSRAYQDLIARIIHLMSPQNISSRTLDEAWSLLPKAASYDIDANLCQTLASAIYSVWLAQDERARLQNANAALRKEQETLQHNAEIANMTRLDENNNAPRNPIAAAEWQKEREANRQIRLNPILARLAEIEATLKANQLKRDLTELQAKTEFQTLIIQFFLQRRFQHVIIANHFYRTIFGDGDTQIKFDEKTKEFFAGLGGLPPTLNVLDSLANEAIRDVREGIEAFRFLLEKGELASAAQRIAETFAIGEYLPEVRTLERDLKRRVLEFTQKSNQLLSALEVKDYTLAEDLVMQLESLAKDFDGSKPRAAIETAQTVAALHLAKARNAAVSGDRETLEAELKAATEIWPRNPALAEVSSAIFSQADVQQQALVDLDRLFTQKNYRQIYEDKVRFIAATALFPERQAKLMEILGKMQQVEGLIIRASEIAKRGDYAGAWENLEQAYKKFPDDPKLNQLRADYTTQAAEFVRHLRWAEEQEQRNQLGSSLALYLKTQQLYPPSELAREGVERLIKKIWPHVEASSVQR